MPRISISAAAQNTFFDAIQVVESFDISISRTFVATIIAQRSEAGEKLA